MNCSIDRTSCNVDQSVNPERNIPEGVPPLKSVYLHVSGNCNLACRHCWIDPVSQTGSSKGRYVEIGHVKKMIAEGKPLGLDSVKLTGGEPTLHPHFRQIVTLLSKAELNISMETNGTLLDQELARFLKKEPRFTFISVSLDGSLPETHDKLRGVQGSYENAIKGIRVLAEEGFKPQVICTLHRENIDEMAELVDMAESMGCGSVKFNQLRRIGRGTLFLRNNNIDIERVIRLSKHVDCHLGKSSKIPIHFSIPMAFYPIRKLNNDPLAGCQVKNLIGMLSGGELALCGIGELIPEFIYGHIGRDNLADVWNNNPGLIKIRTRIPFDLEGICAQCLHRDLCMGECIAYNYHFYGRIVAPHPFCEQAERLGLFPISRKKTQREEYYHGQEN